MIAQQRRYKEGIRQASNLVSLTVALTAVTLAVPAAGRTAHLRKIHIFNANAAPTLVQFGTLVAGVFVQVLPDIYAVNGMDLELTEDQIPDVEFTANMGVQATVAAVAPNNVSVLAEVEEYQGATG